MKIKWGSYWKVSKTLPGSWWASEGHPLLNTATISVVIVIKQEAQSSKPPSQLSDTEGKWSMWLGPWPCISIWTHSHWHSPHPSHTPLFPLKLPVPALIPPSLWEVLPNLSSPLTQLLPPPISPNPAPPWTHSRFTGDSGRPLCSSSEVPAWC